ncbi:MAG: hypothetical protein DMF72_20635 [Acidobacteria bacterium]|nr:MAG: hypothetical protein DMF72_20635 [Acidobacteriota bacterium]
MPITSGPALIGALRVALTVIECELDSILRHAVTIINPIHSITLPTDIITITGRAITACLKAI